MKALFRKAALFIAVVAVLQWAIYIAAPNRGLPSAVQLLETHLQNKTDIIYFGDSILYRGDPANEGTRTLPERTAALLPGHSLGAVAHDAYHPDLFAAFVRYMVRHEQSPRAIVIPLHLRSFSVERDRRPEYQFAREKWFLEHTRPWQRAFFHPMATWRLINLNPISQSEYEQTSVHDGQRRLGAVKSLEQGGLEQFVELCYRYRLTPAHRQLRALADLANQCAEAGIRLIVYVTPLDCGRGDALTEGWFSEYAQRNTAVIQNVLEPFPVTFLNLSCALEPEHFVLQEFPDGYLTAAGKQRLATQIANTLLQVLNE